MAHLIPWKLVAMAIIGAIATIAVIGWMSAPDPLNIEKPPSPPIFTPSQVAEGATIPDAYGRYLALTLERSHLGR